MQAIMLRGGSGMNKQRSIRSRWWGLLSIGVLVLAFVVVPGGAGARESIIKRAVTGQIRGSQLRTPAGIKRLIPMISNGTLAAARGLVAPAEGEDGSQDMRE